MKKAVKILIMTMILMLTAGSLIACLGKSKNVDYLTWKAADWEEADDGGKEAAALAYLHALAGAVNQTLTVEQVQVSLEVAKQSLSTAFAANKEMTIQQMIDAAAGSQGTAPQTEMAQ